MTGTSDPRLKLIFGQALELAGEDRAVYLTAACAGDTGLLARVESLLAAAEKDDRFLQPESTARTRQVKASREPGHQSAMQMGPGMRIGPYELLEQIGEGGFGVVYLAEQKQPVRRRVALKVIKLGMDTRAVIARFEQERQALAIMDHGAPDAQADRSGSAAAERRAVYGVQSVRTLGRVPGGAFAVD